MAMELLSCHSSHIAIANESLIIMIDHAWWGWGCANAKISTSMGFAPRGHNPDQPWL